MYMCIYITRIRINVGTKLYCVHVCTTLHVGVYVAQILSTYLVVKIPAETAMETKWRPVTMIAPATTGSTVICQ